MAEEVTLTDCQFENRSHGIVVCRAVNGTTHTIASIGFTYEITTPGRSVPWVKVERSEYGGDLFKPIAGGMEPNETMNFVFPSGTLPNRADNFEIAIKVTAHSIKDAKGNLIELKP